MSGWQLLLSTTQKHNHSSNCLGWLATISQQSKSIFGQYAKPFLKTFFSQGVIAYLQTVVSPCTFSFSLPHTHAHTRMHTQNTPGPFRGIRRPLWEHFKQYYSIKFTINRASLYMHAEWYIY